MNVRTLVYFALLAVCSAGAAEFQLRVTEKAPPGELGASIRETLQPKSIQVMAGEQLVWEFWLRKEVPLKSAPESDSKALNAIAETTLLGAVTVHRDQRDYRDDEIYKGLYTLRYSYQPQDGDHLGTAPYPFFLVMIPAKADASLAGIDRYKPMVKASGRNTATGHPNVVSVRPPSSSEGDYPRLTKPEAEHEAVLIKISARSPEATEPIELALELVIHGHTSHL